MINPVSSSPASHYGTGTTQSPPPAPKKESPPPDTVQLSQTAQSTKNTDQNGG